MGLLKLSDANSLHLVSLLTFSLLKEKKDTEAYQLLQFPGYLKIWYKQR